MIDKARMADAADALIMWLVTGDCRERLAALDALKEALEGVSAVDAFKAMDALVADVNARTAITPARELH